MGAFIADNFLTSEVLEARLRQLEVGRWGAGWLRQPANAANVADRLVKLLPELLALSSAEARRRFVSAIAADLIAAAPAAKLAAGVLRAVASGERGEALLDAALDLAARALASNDDLLRAEVAGKTFRWLPRWLDDKIADRILRGLAETLAAIARAGPPCPSKVLDLPARLRRPPGDRPGPCRAGRGDQGADHLASAAADPPGRTRRGARSPADPALRRRSPGPRRTDRRLAGRPRRLALRPDRGDRDLQRLGPLGRGAGPSRRGGTILGAWSPAWSPGGMCAASSTSWNCRSAPTCSTSASMAPWSAARWD
ncbi:MAG: DUF445 family protein [Caulobacteraceae bacterium]